MNRKIAIIDCGTNTFHLLITELAAGSEPVVHKKRTVKIGQGGIEKKIIQPEAQERALAVLREFAGLIKENDVVEVQAFATSAFRSAANGRKFRDRILRETNIPISIISGDQEAEWIFKGVRSALKMDTSVALIMDIGGGSVEFILANRESIFWKESFEIGAQRLLDRFFPSDPIPGASVAQLNTYLNEQLSSLLKACILYPPSVLLGASGTFDTLSAMQQLAEGRIPDLQTAELPLTIPGFRTIHSSLLISDQQQRLAMPGMVEMRVDMIVVASCLLEFILSHLPIREIRVSRYALKEGVLAEMRSLKKL